MGKPLSPITYGTPKCDQAAGVISVRRSALDPQRGWLVLDGRAIPVALGRGGIRANWCEDPSSRHYNRPIRLDSGAAGDHLKRDDHLYDFIVEIDHNTRPRVTKRGSAVFLHLARPGLQPTAGCVAMTHGAMLQLLKRLGKTTRIEIG
jgi:L,D-peptidoglycan transpeptidase YkuD (ErfK/YbiS/YcfS/YnhG family)